MRLIDADRFAEISKHHIPKVLEDTFDEGYLACLKAVDLTPTVQAIPVEWFEWLLDTMGDGMYNLRAVIKDWERYKEDWEKENENRVE